MKAFLLIALAFAVTALAEYYQIALKTLGCNKLCNSDLMLDFYIRELILAEEKRGAFNEEARAAFRFFNSNSSLEPTVQFAAAMTLLADAEGLMCRFVKRSRSEYELSHYSLAMLFTDVRKSLEADAFLYGFCHFVFQDKHYILRGKEIELARLFIIYEKHRISRITSFEEFVHQFIRPSLNMFRCEAFTECIRQAISSNVADSFANDYELISELLWNWIFNNERLVTEVMDFMVDGKPDVSFQFQLKNALFESMACHKFQESALWVTGYVVFSYSDNFDKIEVFLTNVFGDRFANNWKSFFWMIFQDSLLKHPFGPICILTQTEFIRRTRENIEYALGIFQSTNPKVVAANLIVQLKLLETFYEYYHGCENEEGETLPGLCIKQIAEHHRVNMKSINYEFPIKEKVIVPSQLRRNADHKHNDRIISMVKEFARENEWDV